MAYIRTDSSPKEKGNDRRDGQKKKEKEEKKNKIIKTLKLPEMEKTRPIAYHLHISSTALLNF
jgi:hypothetical protein